MLYLVLFLLKMVELAKAGLFDRRAGLILLMTKECLIMKEVETNLMEYNLADALAAIPCMALYLADRAGFVSYVLVRLAMSKEARSFDFP